TTLEGEVRRANHEPAGVERKQRELADLARDEDVVADGNANGVVGVAVVFARIVEEIGVREVDEVPDVVEPAAAVRVELERHLLADDGVLRRDRGTQERDGIQGVVDAVLFGHRRGLFLLLVEIGAEQPARERRALSEGVEEVERIEAALRLTRLLALRN